MRGLAEKNVWPIVFRSFASKLWGNAGKSPTTTALSWWDFPNKKKWGQNYGGKTMYGGPHHMEQKRLVTLVRKNQNWISITSRHKPRMDYSTIIKHIPSYGVLLCTICKEPHCIPLGGIGEHYYNYHKDTLTKPQWVALKNYSLTFQKDVFDPLVVPIPPTEDRPIEGLYKTYSYECTECGKLLGAKSSIQDYCYKHGWDKGKLDMWTQKWMQVQIEDISSLTLEFLQSTSIPKSFPRWHTWKVASDHPKSATYWQTPCRVKGKRWTGIKMQYHWTRS